MGIRHLVIGAELRAAADFSIVGKAVSYNKVSPDDQLAPGMNEKVAPGCFRDSLAASGSDCRALVNHNPDRILGRQKNGTLTLTDGPDALRFRVQLDKRSQAHQDVYASVQRGDLNECSFSFVCSKEHTESGVDSKGNACRTRVVDQAQLLDVSIVCWPFYSDPGSTSAEARQAVTRAAKAVNRAAAVKMLRTAAKLAIAEIRLALKSVRGFMDQTDLASMFQYCHEQGEYLRAYMDECESGMNCDQDDCVDGDCRSSFGKAKAGLEQHCEHMAMARLAHGNAKMAKAARK